MFNVVFVFVMLMSALVFVAVVVGMIRHARMAGKIFSIAERQLDEQLSEPASRPSAEPQPRERHVECSHCGSKVAAGVECPNCGAQLA